MRLRRVSVLREDLPVVGRGQVARTWSETATAIARTWRQLPEEFIAADVRDAVDVSKRHVRRMLAEFVEAGYLERHDPGEGLANTYIPTDAPDAGEVDLPERVRPEGEVSPDAPPLDVAYTWNVRVQRGGAGVTAPLREPASSLPAPTSDLDPPDAGVTGG